MKSKSFTTHIKPTWCPGCGNFGIFEALKKALVRLKYQPHEVVFVYDVGCSGNMSDFLNTYGFHALHGRALPVAAGIKLANQNLPVVAIIGDGGCYGEGGTHFLNLMRGNHDITVLVHDNYIYGLTTGQYSPTTIRGSITKTTPDGSIEEALNPVAVALSSHATFAARGYAFDIPHLTDLIVAAIKHKGFSLLDVLQPCVTFNSKNQDVVWYDSHTKHLDKNFKTREAAFKEALKTDQLATGIFWQEKKKAYHEEDKVLQQGALVETKDISRVDIKDLVEEFI